MKIAALTLVVIDESSIYAPVVWFVRERHVSKARTPDIPENNYMLILSEDLGHRPISEMRIDVCPILGPALGRHRSSWS